MSGKTDRRFGLALLGPTTGISLTILVISGALLFFIAYAGLSMNHAAKTSQADLVDAALSEKVNRTLMEQKGLAFWDEGARAASDTHFDTEWFDQEVGAFLTEGYAHDQVYVLNSQDKPIYGYARGHHISTDNLLPIWPLLQPMLTEIRTGAIRPYRRRDQPFGFDQKRYNRLQGARSARWAANILPGKDGPIIVSMMTIVPTVDLHYLRPRPYIIVSIVKLDPAWFAFTGTSLQLPKLSLLDKGSRVESAIPLVADNGVIAGKISWNFRTPGRPILHRILPLFAVLLLFAIFYTRHIFRSLSVAHAQLRSQEANARFLALHDGLSQLPNRRLFTQTLREKLAAVKNTNRVCVAYLDIDRFKDVNDAIGHGAGDALVMQVGPRLIEMLDPGDLLARLGGDEFAVLHELKPGEDPDRLGNAIMSAFKRPFEIGTTQIEVTCSIGIALANDGELDPERVVQDADISLYRAKDRGRNQFVIFHNEMAEEVRARHRLENQLRSAIGTAQIEIYYQPIISARSGDVTSLEALVRWHHPDSGLVQPGLFIPVAEQSGLMVPLGDYIMERVLRDAASIPAGVAIAINLSPLQLRQRTLPDRLMQLCWRFNVDPRRIILEVTESMLIETNGVSNQVFEELRTLGFQTSLDDFGTGYSSLGYLHRFTFDKIKIDRSFVASGSLWHMRPVVEAIVHIGRGLRMEIVAEGVETPAELAMVQALGCTEIQGYGISRPVPLDDALRFIRSTEKKLPDPVKGSIYLAVS